MTGGTTILLLSESTLSIAAGGIVAVGIGLGGIGPLLRAIPVELEDRAGSDRHGGRVRLRRRRGRRLPRTLSRRLASRRDRLVRSRVGGDRAGGTDHRRHGLADDRGRLVIRASAVRSD
ncbi:hypothetical protein [Halalkalicoccus salilacus]|uniref:hypothetical protein n=1 Tax=Halalkalicoccus sp. GCM10025704 TaxID=3252662 RepID=UPI00360B9659